MKLTALFEDFFRSEKAGGVVLLLCAVVSLLLANSPWGGAYIGFWHHPVAGHGLAHWVNDGLMAVFFLLIGLELERELYVGEISTLGQAALPAMAAVGGMLVPAGIHYALNHDLPTSAGAGIPMATDIAFAIGILALLGSRVPASLKVFLTALAVMDDLGAILVIGVFYSDGVQWAWLGGSVVLFATMLVMNRMRVHRIAPYLLLGVVMWYCMLRSGVHATLAGVLLAFAIPFGNGDDRSPSYKLQHVLHRPVAYLVMPIFALANTCIALGADPFGPLLQPNALGIMAGLVIGKPLGVVLFCAIGIATGLCVLPADVRMGHVVGAGMLAGIGFTMSIFIALLAFSTPAEQDTSKVAVMLASLLSALFGVLVLKWRLPKRS
ncbi:MAG: Na+/H+ antiporter NhaA [Flavobacteriales bacterium]|nr:MAG: Na+/H+ antiporter NhaA [Flavobacteriales bacterium]